MPTEEGYRMVSVQIPNTLYRRVKQTGVVMSVVMRQALEAAVKREEEVKA